VPRLKNRQSQVPNGMAFFIPHIKWSPPPYMSIDQIARNAISVLQANPSVAAKLGWDLSIPAMSDRVDEYNAARCLQLGYAQFVLAEGGQPDIPPFLGHPSQNPNNPSNLQAAAAGVKKIWQGIRTMNEWADAGFPHVEPDKSTARAAVCITCPKNTAGDFSSWFTKPAAEGIRRLTERAKGINLTTPHDEQLNVCDVCLCPMKLKVHIPIEVLRNGTSNETLAELRAVTGCWIVKEIAGS